MNTTGKHTKRKWLKRLLIGFAITFVLLLLLPILFEKAIGRRIVSEINDNINTEIRVKDFSLSLIRSFPSVTLDLRNVVLIGTDEQIMFKAAHLRFQFGLFSLFSKKIDIQSVIAEKGALLLKVNKNGKSNYDILKPSDTKAKNDVAFVLKKAILEDITIGYDNFLDAQNIGLTINNATFKGAFSAKNFELKSDADLHSHGVTLSNNTFLQNNKLRYSTAIKVDLEKKRYDIKQFELDIEKNIFDVTGTVQSGKNSNTFDLDFNGKKCDLSSLLQLLPNQYRTPFADFESDGNISATASVKGVMSKTQNPAIVAELNLKNGSLKSNKLSNALENVNFTANFSNGTERNAASTSFLIPDFQGFFGKQELNLKLGVKNLDLPFIDFYLNGKIPVQAVHELMLKKSSEGSGFITLQDLSVQGFLSDMKSLNRISQVKMSGNIDAEKIAMVFPNGQLNVPSGNIKFDNNNITIKDLGIEGLENAIVLNGNVSNFLPVFLKDSTQQNAKLDFTAKLIASKLNLNKLLAATATDKKTTNTSKNNTSKNNEKPFYKYLSGTFQSDIQDFEYQRFRGKNFLGVLNFDDDNIGINGNVEAMGGTMALKGRIALHKNADLHATVAANQIDATTFFYQCENFGQSVLQDKNIKGKLNARIVIDGKWNEKGNFSNKDLVAYAYLNIQNGELKNIKMLEEFSTFVKIEDLHNIKFTNLENWFEIRDNWTYMPVMELRNNALNMSVSGSHSFNNDINYNVKVNAAQVVINRFKKFNPRLSPQKDIEDDGLFDLFFNMKGTLDKYEIEQAKSYVKGEFERGIIRRREIQTKLNAAMSGKDYQLQEKMLFKAEKNTANANAMPIPKDKTPQKNFVLPKNYKPKTNKKEKDE
jgi:hypothetical protein